MIAEHDSLHREARAFGDRAQERVRHGHIPDLRRAEPCDWFYNNPWRRPHLVDLLFGTYFRFAMANINGTTLLEVGSGVGHMALEFARNGLSVTGLELAPGAVEVARRVADENPFRDNFGSLDYVEADFLKWEPRRQFDNFCFFCTLHHFEDPEQVLARAQTLLNPAGRIIVIEPARDRYSEKDAALVAVIRWLIGAHEGWHETLTLPASEAEMTNGIQAVLREF